MLAPEEIKALREYTEMTPVQMAQLFRVRPADVIAWEKGTLQPDAEQMQQLARLRRQERIVEPENPVLEGGAFTVR